MSVPRWSRRIAGVIGVVLGVLMAIVPPPAQALAPRGEPAERTERTERVMVAAPSLVPASLQAGDSGPAVKSLQRRLTALGYWCGPVDGRFGTLTRYAVIALQKAAGLPRTGVAGARTQSALDRGVRPKARSNRGLVVEVSLAKQLLLVVRDGRVVTILHSSTGSGRYYRSASGSLVRAITPRGSFRVLRQIDGWRHARLGWLWRPKYYTSYGLAVHGFSSVPVYPASHGCIRLHNRAMDLMWSRGYLPIGGRIVIY